MGVIAPATAADCKAVVALWQQCGLTRPWNDPKRDFALAAKGEGSVILILREAIAPVAAVMVGYDGHRGWAYYLAVTPERRGEGIGRRMMAAAEEWLRERGCPKLQLMVRGDNPDALEFYRALGFEAQDVVTLGKRL